MELVQVKADNPCALLKCGQCRLHKCACEHARGVGVCKDFIFPARKHGADVEDEDAVRHLGGGHDVRQKTIYAMCSRKHRFADEYAAHKAIKRIVANGGKQLREYECYFCHRWHLTSQLLDQTAA